MGMNTTYSFLDLSGSIASPVGPFVFTGEGVGEVVVTMAVEKTVHDVAADGSVMVSKVAGNNGTITIHTQQTSPLHKWLLSWFNAILAGTTDMWASSAVFLRNTIDGSSHVATGISPQKIPDKTYQAQGQRVTWVLMAADIQSLPA